MIARVSNRRPAPHASYVLVVIAPIALSLMAPAHGEVLDREQYIRDHYVKHEYRVPMRDGATLFTAVFSPKDDSQPYPFLMTRTPYSVAPYGEDAYPGGLGPHWAFVESGYIFVEQDVRGRFMSEGEFVNMTPHLEVRTSKDDVDESTDTYDTIEWLLENVPNNNGRVGLYGISYRGFYAAAGMIDAHPALKAVSPQAPIADWFFEDFHHHGAFCLSAAVNFFYSFGRPRPELTTEWPPRLDHGTPDGYRFFLDLGPLRSVSERYFHDEVAFWKSAVAHPNYDAFWQTRNILPHLHDVAPAVLVVGGWFDLENLYGALNIYQSTEAKNPDVDNLLVMGPWVHGGWTRTDGERLGNIHFGARTSDLYCEQIDFPFFEFHLKDRGECGLAEATVFETGVNRWRFFDDWPPAEVEPETLYLHPHGRLAFEPVNTANRVSAYDEYISDPSKPVPYAETISTRITQAYMTDDQRFAARRPDVLVYQTEPLEAEVTLAGPLLADLWVSTSGSSADWIVKLIDVFPPDAPQFDEIPDGRPMGGYQMMVRSEVMRGRFRNGYDHPEPFVPNESTSVRVPLQDVLHTFRKGHRIMVQIQSTWFPLIDRNPQRYVENIFLADEDDFITTNQRVYRTPEFPSQIRVGVLPAGGAAPEESPRN
jgi:putative CocE/NonD family hydrolase